MAAATDRLANYVPVNERLERFYSDHPEGRVLTTVLEHSAENGFILMRAEIYRSPDDSQPAATGHAFENRSEGYVNKTSYIENCETSCVGRGLALLGYEIKRGIASREEMQKVERMGSIRAVPDNEKITEAQAVDLVNLAGEVGADIAKFFKYLKIEKLADLPASSFDNAVKALEKKRGK